jgi:hypothetical protein
MLEGSWVVYGGDDAVEERGGVEGGGRCRVVDGSVIVCEQSVVIHHGYEGVARIWGRSDKHGMLLPRLVSPWTYYHGTGWAGFWNRSFNCGSFDRNRSAARGSEMAHPPCIKTGSRFRDRFPTPIRGRRSFMAPS